MTTYTRYGLGWIALVGLLLTSPAWGQDVSFRVVGDSLPPVQSGDVGWADIDADGDLDIAKIGSQAAFYLNYGDSSFVRTGGGTAYITRYRTPFGGGGLDPRPPSPLERALEGALAWQDVDGDNDVDLAVTGRDAGNALLRLYEAVPPPLYLRLDATLPGVYRGDLAWGDLDNDGDADLLYIGLDATGSAVAGVYENRAEQGGGLVPRTVGIDGLEYGSIAVGDYDGDGDLDVLTAGVQPSPQTLRTTVYRNDGDFVLSPVPVGLKAQVFAEAAWADVDSDGDLDVVVNGGRLSPFLVRGSSRVYRNDGGAFTDLGPGAPGGYFGGQAWGDLDNDGDPDQVYTGGSAPLGTRVLDVNRNEDGVLTPLNLDLAGYFKSTLALGDYDRDGDLDVHLLGEGGTAAGSQLRNEIARANQPPTPPEGLQARREGSDLIFSWTPSVDAETPTAALTYNLRVGTVPGGTEVVSPMADPATGYRYVDRPGNVGAATQWRLRGVPEGAYYWSVQAIDAGYRSSDFGEEQIFTTGDPDDTTPPAPPSGLAALPGDAQVRISWNANPEEDLARYRIYRSTTPGADERIASITAGTGLTYVDEDVQNDVTYYYRLTAVDITGNESAFSDEVSATPEPLLVPLQVEGLPIAQGNAVAWGDWDADGDLDLVSTGETQQAFTQILRNEEGRFTDIQARRPDVSDGAVAWGDYDADGDLDLALSGAQSFLEEVVQVHRNDGDGAFVRLNTTFDEVARGRVQWGDLDGDGDLDLFVVGSFIPNGRDTLNVYRNDGSDTFVDIEAELPSVRDGDAIWGDWDGDGDLDVAVSGEAADGPITRIYLYDDGQYVLGPSLQGLTNAHLAWGDFNNDGRLDLAASGGTVISVTTRIYFNLPGGVEATAQGLPEGSVEMLPGDFDNDGWLDLAVIPPSRNAISILVNTQERSFRTVATLDDVEEVAVAWGDYDGDADLDLLAQGSSRSRIYQNNVRPGNTPPAAPSGLATTVEGDAVTLSWNAAADAQAPGGLTYNVRLGTSPGAGDVIPPMALDDGTRQVPAPGNAGARTTRTLQDLPEGTYYWTVQAVDASFVGSAFAQEQTFTVGSGGAASGLSSRTGDSPE